jgi:hypothetical protein
MISGFFLGIQSKTGKDVDPNSVAIEIGKNICSSIDDPKVSSQCNSTMTLAAIAAFIAGILEIWVTVSEVPWVIGLAVYIFGLIVGFMVVSGG